MDLARSTYFEVERFSANPIIRPNMPGLEGELSENINGPSLIPAPEWLDQRLGRYYLYFAHHRGRFIRLAYADQLEGPWTIYDPGTLRLDQTPCEHHIASPDVHVDNRRRTIWMYYHGSCGDQVTFLARSKDGLSFESGSEVLGKPYFRAFHYDNGWYASAMNGQDGGLIYRSRDGQGAFETGPQILPGVRHTAVWVKGNILFVFYTLVGEAPERIQVSTIDLTANWTDWTPSPPQTVLEPAYDYEGADLPLVASKYGLAKGRVRQLRDPAIYVEADRVYLLYSVAGEQGIAVAGLLRTHQLS